MGGTRIEPRSCCNHLPLCKPGLDFRSYCFIGGEKEDGALLENQFHEYRAWQGIRVDTLLGVGERSVKAAVHDVMRCRIVLRLLCSPTATR